MEAARSVLIAIGGLIAFGGALAFLWAGTYEMGVGRRPPGFMGRGLLAQRKPVGAGWSPDRWRRNGFQVIVMGIGLLVLALWAFFAALKLTS